MSENLLNENIFDTDDLFSEVSNVQNVGYINDTDIDIGNDFEDDLFGGDDITDVYNTLIPETRFTSIADTVMTLYKFNIKLKLKEVVIHVCNSKQKLLDYCNEIGYKYPTEWEQYDDGLVWVVESHKPVLNIKLYNKIVQDCSQSFEVIDTTINNVLKDLYNSDSNYESKYIAEHLCV